MKPSGWVCFYKMPKLYIFKKPEAVNCDICKKAISKLGWCEVCSKEPWWTIPLAPHKCVYCEQHLNMFGDCVNNCKVDLLKIQ